MYTVYGDTQSGNCYKIQLLMSHLGIEHQWQHVDILKGETRTDAFLGMNPNGKIPVLKTPQGQYLSESNAIIHYLAEGSELLPNNPWLRAKVLEWQFFEQYSHEPFIAVARFIIKYQGRPQEREAELQATREGGYKALAVMEQHLKQSPWLVGSTMTIADIALFAYTHVAEEGGFSLADFPAIQGWIRQVESHPAHRPMS